MKSIAHMLFLLLMTSGALGAPRPNVVLIFIDDLGYADLGCFGAKGFETPRLDGLARDGVRFTSFYVAQAVCSASRMALQTGCYPNRVGLLGALGPDARHGIASGETTLGEMMRTQGYRTCAIGKWHLGHHPEFLPLRHGYDEYLGLPYSNDMWPVDYDGRPRASGRKGGYPALPLIEGERTIGSIDTLQDQDRLTGRFTDRAVDFIERSKGQPFFLYIAHSMVHVPLGVSPDFRGRSKAGLFGDVMMEVDHSTGRILDALDRTGAASNTLVIFTSDNGPWLNFGDHAGSAGPLREGKGTMWEGGCRVPCIMRWPGRIAAGRTSDAIMATIDLFPTLAGLTGAPLPEHPLDGVDQQALLLDASAPSARSSYAYFYGDELQAYREGRWKLIFPHSTRTYEGQPRGKDGKPGPQPSRTFSWLLYDLEQDPGERTDQLSAHPELVERLKKAGRAFESGLKANRRPAGRLPAAHS